MSFLEYAPAPESRAILRLRDEYGLFIDGEFRPGTGECFATISPADESHIATIASASEADVDAAVVAARRALRQDVVEDERPRPRQVPLPHRAARAGARTRARCGGEPRQRQAHQGEPRCRHPAGGRMVLLLRGLGRQARLRGARRRPEAARRRRADHPVELPAADARVEDRPRARRGQHGRAQARRDHAADGAAVRRDPAAGRSPGGRRQHRDRRRRDGRDARAASRCRQDRLHRLDRLWAARSPRPSPAPTRR